MKTIKYAFSLCIYLVFFSSNAQTFIIDFDNAGNWTAGSGGITSYQTDHEYQDLNWVFTGGPALRQGTANQDGFPGALGTYSWRLRDAPCTWTGTFNNSADIASFGFDVRRWDGSPNPDWDIEYSTNGGGAWTNVGNINNTFLSNSSDWTSFSYTLPSITSVASGDFVVRIQRNGGERIMIDNFTWTQVEAQLNIDNLSALLYNINCSNTDSGSLDFSSNGTFNLGNTLTVELSDENGDFTNPLQIGTLSGASAEGNDISGNINYTIPAGIPSSSIYRIRITSSDPTILSDDNGDDITINLDGNCIPPHITSLIINACFDSCSEGDNEFFFGNTGDYEMDFNADNTNVYYGTNPSPTANYTETIVDLPSTTDDFNTNAGCPGLFIDAYNTTIPPNSSFLIAHENVCPLDEQDFSGLFSDGPIYIIYVDASSWNTGGNFANSTSCSGGFRYLQSDFTTTVNTNHVIDFYYECSLNSGNDGDYAVWDSGGGEAILHDNDNCSYSNNVLPVELIDFFGIDNGNSSVISWITATEQNNHYLNLYHSIDGKEFTFIHREEGNGTTGNLSEYEYIHHRITPGINYYKLESVDYDGTIHDKGIISVLAESRTVYYNESLRRIIFSSKSDFAIYSPEGRLLKTTKNSDSYPFSGRGIYFIIDMKTLEKHKLFIGY
jgi:hypothetical protein